MEAVVVAKHLDVSATYSALMGHNNFATEAGVPVPLMELIHRLQNKAIGGSYHSCRVVSGGPGFEQEITLTSKEGVVPNRYYAQITGRGLIHLDGREIQVEQGECYYLRSMGPLEKVRVVGHPEESFAGFFLTTTGDSRLPNTPWQDLSMLREEDIKSLRNKELIEKIQVIQLWSPEQCKRWIDSLEKDRARSTSVYMNGKSEINEEQRLAYALETPLYGEVCDSLEEAIPNAENFFDQAIEFWERPQIIMYPTGGYFKPHYDGVQGNHNDGWTRVYDRDFTLVVFLNEDYEGGELAFPDLDFSVKPKTGQAVIFPAGSDYLHAAEAVTKGTRFQLVSWLTAYGTPRTGRSDSVLYRRWK